MSSPPPGPVKVICMAGLHEGPVISMDPAQLQRLPIDWRRVRCARRDGKWVADIEGTNVLFACPLHTFEGEAVH